MVSAIVKMPQDPLNISKDPILYLTILRTGAKPVARSSAPV